MIAVYYLCWADMGNSYQEYKDWIGDEIDKETDRKYNKALSKLRELIPFEKQLVSLIRSCIY